MRCTAHSVSTYAHRECKALCEGRVAKYCSSRPLDTHAKIFHHVSSRLQGWCCCIQSGYDHVCSFSLHFSKLHSTDFRGCGANNAANNVVSRFVSQARQRSLMIWTITRDYYGSTQRKYQREKRVYFPLCRRTCVLSMLLWMYVGKKRHSTRASEVEIPVAKNNTRDNRATKLLVHKVVSIQNYSVLLEALPYCCTLSFQNWAAPVPTTTGGRG